MSQEFDIHRELWDYCDDNSRRISPFYPPSPSPTNFPTIEQIDEFLEILDQESPPQQEPKNEKERPKTPPPPKPPVLDTPLDIWNYMTSVQKNTS